MQLQLSKQAVNENFSAKLFEDAIRQYKQTLQTKPNDYRGKIYTLTI